MMVGAVRSTFRLFVTQKYRDCRHLRPSRASIGTSNCANLRRAASTRKIKPTLTPPHRRRVVTHRRVVASRLEQRAKPRHFALSIVVVDVSRRSVAADDIADLFVSCIVPLAVAASSRLVVSNRRRRRPKRRCSVPSIWTRRLQNAFIGLQMMATRLPSRARTRRRPTTRTSSSQQLEVWPPISRRTILETR